MNLELSKERRAIRDLGRDGLSKNYIAERHVRDAKIHQISDGTNQAQPTTIARHLNMELT